ncbi:MAG: hypothetical protein ACHP65_05900 [Legionellales bacterium]
MKAAQDQTQKQFETVVSQLPPQMRVEMCEDIMFPAILNLLKENALIIDRMHGPESAQAIAEQRQTFIELFKQEGIDPRLKNNQISLEEKLSVFRPSFMELCQQSIDALIMLCVRGAALQDPPPELLELQALYMKQAETIYDGLTTQPQIAAHPQAFFPQVTPTKQPVNAANGCCLLL